ncbi:Protein YghO [Thermoflexales bacterium]|nr:Protein YghO [Thermoflexales bacterium]
MSVSELEIIECLTPQQRDEFIFFQWVPYQGNPYWVPPLISERREFYDKTKHPFHEHADVAMFLAKRGGQAVGTIYAIDNRAHNEFHQENIGMFGGFECLNDQAVAHALFERAEKWLRARGRTALRGPFNFSTNEECGLLIDAFDDAPRVMMTYNPPYYRELIEREGYTKAVDMFAYRREVNAQIGLDNFPPKMKRIMEKIMQRDEIVIRKIDLKHLSEEISRVQPVYNAAWADNWGFVPMTPAEFDHLAHSLLSVIDPDLLLVVEAKGQPIGVALSLPDICDPLRRAYPQPGTPEWWTLVKFMFHYKVRKTQEYVRVLIMGVIPKYRLSGIDGLLMTQTAEIAMKKGYTLGEASWILENNLPMRSVLENTGWEIYKTYRILEKAL